MNRPAPVTGTGVGVTVFAVLCYACGVVLGYPVLVALAVGALTMLLVGACSVAVRPSVVLSRQVTPDRVTAGESALGLIQIRNTSRRPSPSFTAVDRIGAQTVPLAVRGLPPGGQRVVHYPVPAARRGRIVLGPLTVERRDPLGLFAWARRQTSDDVLWVHPRVHSMRPLPVGVVLDYEGRISENPRLGTVTFSSLREYVPGDDPRQIHWRSTARTGTLIVREHVDTTESTTTVVLDTRAAVFDKDSFEHAVEVAASVVRAVQETGRPVTLRVLAERDAAGTVSELDRLTLAQRDPDADAVRLLGEIDRTTPGGALVVVTGAAEDGPLARLAEQRRRFRPVVVVSLLGSHGDGATGLRRRPGMVVLTARSAAEAAVAWNRMISGDTG